MSDTDPQQRAATLVEALPYIRRFAGKTVVVKYGGNALAGTTDHDALAFFAEDIVLMRLVGMRPVVVHGGGPQISALMARLGKTTEFRDGLRVTDAETVDIARMVLRRPGQPAAGRRHQRPRQLRRRRQRRGRRPAAGHASATRRSASSATSARSTPTSSTACWPTSSSRSWPPSAPTPPGRPTTSTPTSWPAAIAEALGAEKLVYLTDIEGLRRDVADPASLIRQTTADELDELIADGTIAGGMIPKVEACTHAVRNGVGRAHILDGRIAHVLLLEIFTDEGIGTMVTNPTMKVVPG